MFQIQGHELSLEKLKRQGNGISPHNPQKKHNSAFEWFSLLAIVNNAAVNICLQTCIWTHVFILGYIVGSGIVVLYNNCMFTILKNCQTIFQSNLPFFTPTSSVWGFHALQKLSSFIIVLFIIAMLVVWSHPSLCFWFVFHWWLMILSNFSCGYHSFVYLSWNVYSDFLICYDKKLEMKIL